MVIYKITNIVNNKIYIGQDKNNKSGYLGSGDLIKLAKKKYKTAGGYKFKYKNE